MIEKMERIFLYGLRRDSEEVISRLMKSGCVQINDPSRSADYEEIKDEVERLASDAYEKEQLLSKLSQCIRTLSPYAGKKGLFARRGEVKFEELSRCGSLEKALRICGEVEGVQREIAGRKSRISAEEFRKTSLLPWESMDLALEDHATAATVVLLGVVPANFGQEELEKSLEEGGIDAYVSPVSEDKDQRYLAFVAHSSQKGALEELLRQCGGGTVSFEGLRGTASENIASCEKRTLALEEEIESLKERLKAYSTDLPEVQLAYDAAQVSIDCAKARQNLLVTQETFALEAWVPQRQKARVEKTLEQYSCYYEFEPASEEDDPPVLLKNNRFVEPFESVTEMYSLPSPHALDPDPFIAPFYFIFFGMMLSDAGYGLILALGGFLGSKFLDMGPTGKKMLKMFGYCGLSTIFWGALYGSWFGDAIQQVASTFFGVQLTIPALINPLEEPMTLLIMSLALGVVQIFVGMGLKAYLMIRRGHLLDAIFDVGFWYCLLGGLLLLVAGGTVGTVGKWLAIAGAAGLVLTQGRDKKNPIMKLLSGVMSLYDITGYFSDVLSYSRIMALGLATGVIASVVNTMGALPGRNIVGAVLFIVIFLFGHTLNLGINALGSYVHSSRLQYVEFFGKFYESGGKPFAPLKANTKYVRVMNQEEN